MITRRDFLAGSVPLGLAAAPSRALRSAARGSRRQQHRRQQPPPVTPVFTAIRRNVGFFTGRGGTIGYLIDPAASSSSTASSRRGQALSRRAERAVEEPRDRPADQHASSRRPHARQHGLQAVGEEGRRAREGGRAHEDPAGPRRRRRRSSCSRPRRSPTPGGSRSATSGCRRSTTAAAHTSGDAVITFERANVAHMGDLMFNQRHPVVDQPAGAIAQELDHGAREDRGRSRQRHDLHLRPRGPNQPVTGSRADLMVFRDYLTALLAFVQGEIKAGKTQRSDHRDPDASAGLRLTRQPRTTSARGRVRRAVRRSTTARRTRAAMRSSPSSARMSCTWATSCSTAGSPWSTSRRARSSRTGSSCSRRPPPRTTTTRSTSSATAGRISRSPAAAPI